jgi:integrase
MRSIASRTGSFSRTRRDAQAFLTEQLARLDTGSYAAPAKTTLGEFLDSEWLPAVKPTLRPLSHDRYSRVVRLYIQPHIGGIRLQALSAGDITSMHGKLEEQGLSLSTRRLVHAVIGRSLRDAERWGRVPRNVARLADRPAQSGSRATSWTAGEVQRFLAHVQGDRFVALWRLAATTGMRRGEPRGRDVADARPCDAACRAAARAYQRRSQLRTSKESPVATDDRAG